MSYFVYMLQCSDDTFYIGYTNNIEKRVYSHNYLKSGAKYTRSRRPVVLKYFEKFSSLSDALKREYALKKLNKQQKKQLFSRGSLHTK